MNRVFVTHRLLTNPAGWALPLPVRWSERWQAGVVVSALSASLYMVTNHLGVREPSLLPLTAADQWIAFWPGSIWFYASGVLYMPAVYSRARCLASLNRHLWSFSALVFLSCVVFAVLPTTYPRELYPLPEGTDVATRWVFDGMRSYDRPLNCLPSLHVGVALLVCLGFTQDRKRDLFWVAPWSLLLALSALTTKQHYVIDAVSGAFLAVGVFWVFHRWMPARFTDRVREGRALI